METHIKNHVNPTTGLPDGGYVRGIGFNIEWQNGPLGDGENPIRNGALLEDVIGAVLQRLEHFQRAPIACRENDEAIDCLRAALACLARRTARRRAAGIEGQMFDELVQEPVSLSVEGGSFQ